jgi:undecaprenyl diphosphate synthase
MDLDKRIKLVLDGKIPKHVAVIMDGNGRWAKQRGMSRIEGHKEGTVSAQEIIENALKLKIKYLTLYTFSSENWKRPIFEINKLMEMLYESLINQRELLIRNKVKLKILGDKSKLPKKLVAEIDNIEGLSAKFKNIQVNLALNYGSRDEIVYAVKNIIADGIDEKKINQKLIEKYLYTKNIPDPDLVIRTSGEYRISNFLLYQIAYSELYFTDVYWPDFRMDSLVDAIIDYQGRKRRYGAI